MHKILIIEDEQSIAQLYNIVFSRRNYSVELAYNGQEGLDKVKTFMPDIILVDVMMPVMNGMEVLKAVKADPQLKHIPVMVISNLTEASTEKSMISEGAAKFIVKSQTLPDEMVNIVNIFLNGDENKK